MSDCCDNPNPSPLHVTTLAGLLAEVARLRAEVERCVLLEAALVRAEQERDAYRAVLERLASPMWLGGPFPIVADAESDELAARIDDARAALAGRAEEGA